MQLAPAPVQNSRRPVARAQALAQVKFMMLPLPVECECEPEPVSEESFSRLLFRVIGRLVAARP